MARMTFVRFDQIRRSLNAILLPNAAEELATELLDELQRRMEATMPHIPAVVKDFDVLYRVATAAAKTTMEHGESEQRLEDLRRQLGRLEQLAKECAATRDLSDPIDGAWMTIQFTRLPRGEIRAEVRHDGCVGFGISATSHDLAVAHALTALAGMFDSRAMGLTRTAASELAEVTRLHQASDLLLAQYLLAHPRTLPSQISVMDIAQWNKQRIDKLEGGQ